MIDLNHTPDPNLPSIIRRLQQAGTALCGGADLPEGCTAEAYAECLMQEAVLDLQHFLAGPRPASPQMISDALH
jgi:hypothetical protein